MVSIIVPNYNHAPFLKQRFESILNQTYTDFELIILDDCSTDNSREVIEQYQSNTKISKIIYNEQNSGNTFKQWNKGISYAKGEYIWIAESDDFCEKNFLEKLLSYLENDKEIALAYSSTKRINAEGDIIDDLQWWYGDLGANRWNVDHINNGRDEIKRYLAFKNTIPNASAVIFKKSIFNEIGRAPTDYILSGDWLFWMQLIEKYKICYCTGTTNYFRVHQRSVRNEQSSSLTSLIEKLKIYKYLNQNGLITDEFRFRNFPVLQNEISGVINKAGFFTEPNMHKFIINLFSFSSRMGLSILKEKLKF
jgi:glycosyltransferase involved in cell wall biosynthesis